MFRNGRPPARRPPAPNVTEVPSQTVQVQPEQPIVATPKTNPPAPPRPWPRERRHQYRRPNGSLEVPMPEEQPKTGFWHRLFNSDKTYGSAKRYHEDTVTPIPATTDEMAGTKPADANPLEPQPVPVATIPAL
jgi:hypothetical protein